MTRKGKPRGGGEGEKGESPGRGAGEITASQTRKKKPPNTGRRKREGGKKGGAFPALAERGNRPTR